jgi:hypothetical protein
MVGVGIVSVLSSRAQGATTIIAPVGAVDHEVETAGAIALFVV